MLRRIVFLVILGGAATLAALTVHSHPTSAPSSQPGQLATQPGSAGIDARFARIADVLRPRTATVEVMEPVFSEAFTALSRRLARGVADHRQWWKEYSQAHAEDDGPMPYHANMGLSEDEYAEYQRLADGLQQKVVRKLTLVIREQGDGRYSIHGPKESPDLQDVVIDLARGTITTPVGETAGPLRLGPTAKLTGLGPWTGFQWKAAGHDPETQTGWTLQFAIGHIAKSGRAAILYKAKKVESGQPPINAQYLLVFPEENAASQPAASQPPR